MAHFNPFQANPRADHRRRAVPQPGAWHIHSFPATQSISDQQRNIANAELNQGLRGLNDGQRAFHSDRQTTYIPLAPPPPPPVNSVHNRPYIPSIPRPIPRTFQPSYYGNCSETIPLAVAASISWQIGPATEIHTLAAYTNKLSNVRSITEDGIFDASIPLLEPCLNCRKLMSQIPGSTWMLTGFGMSQDVRWIVEKRGSLCGRQFRRVASGYSEFSYTVAYAANKAVIYDILNGWTIGSVGAHVKADVRRNLVLMWHEFIDPYRRNQRIFRLDASGKVDPLMVRVNNTSIPICTVFCAMAYILSNVLEPLRGYTQSTAYFLPLMAILAKWCQILCPWGHPNVISVIGITSWSPKGVTRFLLGTTKPFLQRWARQRYIKRLGPEMKQCRKELLEQVFGRLPEQ